MTNDATQECLALLRRIAASLERLTTRAVAPRPKSILSQREAARRLGVRNTTIADMVVDGKILTVKVSGRLKIPAAEVERLARDGFDTRQS